MKVALTGATGFIGRYIAKQLIDDGHQVVAWYRSEESKDALSPLDIEWVKGTLGEQEACKRLLQDADALIHSALARPTGAWNVAPSDIVSFAERNIMGSLQLFSEAYESQLSRTIFLSTCAVHDIILQDRTLDESHPLWARSHYGAHKAAIEKFVHSLGLGEGMPICAVRPSGVYGMKAKPEQSKYYELVKQVQAGESVTTTRGGKEVHAADVAKACTLLLEADADAITGQSYNCCDRYISQYDVAQLAKKLTGSAARIEGEQIRPKNQIDTSKLEALGFSFGGDSLLETTIREILNS